MKRTELEDMNGRKKASGKIKRFGLANIEGEKIVTALLVDVKVEMEEKIIEIDHSWVMIGYRSYRKDLEVGSMIEFTCKKEEYYYAPDYVTVQGYGLKKVRDIQICQKGCGKTIEKYIDAVKNKVKLRNCYGI